MRRRRRHSPLDLLRQFGGEIISKARMKYERFIFEYQSGKDTAKKKRIVIAVILSTVFFGGQLIYMMRQGYLEIPGFFGDFGRFIQKSIPEAGIGNDGSLSVADFEKNEELSCWKLTSATMEAADQHVSRGAKSIRVVFMGKKPVASIAMDTCISLSSRSNWKPFETFQFYAVNSSSGIERVILQIKDAWNRKFKYDLHLAPQKGELIQIPIKEIAAQINIQKIDQLSLFRWAPRDTREFYFDDFRLIKGFSRHSASDSSQDSPRRKLKQQTNPVDYGFQNRKAAWMFRETPEAEGEIVRIPFIVGNERGSSCLNCAVSGGIPFALGELQDSVLTRLVNAERNEIPFKREILARWPDNSIKWLGIHFNTTILPNQAVGFFLDYGEGAAASVQAAAAPAAEGEVLDKPLILRNNPYWVDATGALGRLYPVEERYLGEEKTLEKIFEWAVWHPELEEYYAMGTGFQTGALLQFARSGQWKYFEFAENLIQHWQTSPKGPEGENAAGFVLYYYLSADGTMLQKLKDMGESFLKPLGDNDLPQRYIANALWAGILLFDITGDERYKKLADQMIEIYLAGQQPDGAFLENYNPKSKTWSGGVNIISLEQYSLGAFIAYHDLTQNEKVKDMILQTVDFFITSQQRIPNVLHGLAYAYFLTHDEKYLNLAEEALAWMRQLRSQPDPASLGALATVPYIFAALEERFANTGR